MSGIRLRYLIPLGALAAAVGLAAAPAAAAASGTFTATGSMHAGHTPRARPRCCKTAGC